VSGLTTDPVGDPPITRNAVMNFYSSPSVQLSRPGARASGDHGDGSAAKRRRCGRTTGAKGGRAEPQRPLPGLSRSLRWRSCLRAGPVRLCLALHTVTHQSAAGHPGLRPACWRLPCSACQDAPRSCAAVAVRNGPGVFVRVGLRMLRGTAYLIALSEEASASASESAGSRVGSPGGASRYAEQRGREHTGQGWGGAAPSGASGYAEQGCVGHADKGQTPAQKVSSPELELNAAGDRLVVEGLKVPRMVPGSGRARRAWRTERARRAACLAYRARPATSGLMSGTRSSSLSWRNAPRRRSSPAPGRTRSRRASRGRDRPARRRVRRGSPWSSAGTWRAAR
jgi:hypothetical protein